jgi:hypothetical protein
VKKIVERHGVRIWAASMQGEVPSHCKIFVWLLAVLSHQQQRRERQGDDSGVGNRDIIRERDE